MNNLTAIRKELRAQASPEKAAILQRYFKTGKGEYGEGDRFLGLTVPQQRQIAKEFKTSTQKEDIIALLDSAFHEERLTGLFILNHKFIEARKKGNEKEWVDLYLSKTARINNWDLVDSSAPVILGQWLKDKERHILYELARSPLLWDNRIAIMATLPFIRDGDHDDILRLAEMMLTHPHDLMHKATGWMLREAWCRDPESVETFLEKFIYRMPRTMLRYAIEKMPEAQRKAVLKKK